MKLFLCLLSGFAIFCLRAETMLSGCKNICEGSVAGKFAFAENFEHSNLSFKRGRAVSGEGLNGSRGFLLEIKDANAKESASGYIPIALKPSAKYRLTFQYRLEDINFNHSGRLDLLIATVDYFKNPGRKTWLTGTYPGVPNQKNTDGWVDFSSTFTTPEKFAEAYLLLFLGSPCTGKVYYDNIAIEECGVEEAMIYPLLPKNLTFTENGKVMLRVHNYDRGEKLKVSAALNGMEKTADVNDGIAMLEFPDFKDGENTLVVAAFDPVRKESYGKSKWILHGRHHFKKHVETALDGSLTIDGKPFLPVGIFTHAQRLIKHDLSKIRDAGFNFIMPYGSLKLKLNKGMEPQTGKDLVAILDEIAAKKLKIAFSLNEQYSFPTWEKVTSFDGAKGVKDVSRKVVASLKDHKALLGWYISDENPDDQLPEIREQRELISAIDPSHPVLTLTNAPARSLGFGPTGDVLLTDSYPITDSTPQNMTHLRTSVVTGLKNTRLGPWLAPQAFHWGVYRSPFSKYRIPTEMEMRSMVLLGMNLGCKGYLFFSYGGIFSQRNDPGASKKFWPEVARVAKLLRELEPYFFTREIPPEISVENRGKSYVEAKTYRNNGKVISVITADGPGKADALIRIKGCSELKSRFGLTKYKDGAYHFSAKDVASDILE